MTKYLEKDKSLHKDHQSIPPVFVYSTSRRPPAPPGRHPLGISDRPEPARWHWREGPGRWNGHWWGSPSTLCSVSWNWLGKNQLVTSRHVFMFFMGTLCCGLKRLWVLEKHYMVVGSDILAESCMARLSLSPTGRVRLLPTLILLLYHSAQPWDREKENYIS